ncbi:hypothetical protein ACFC26_16350 [Kitasatospora purpeofusca]|uniref:hypothetical protein n=1 Tax=Kitasatospora purpeofusca TaxID=67352 RepID=UPI0035DDA898
MDALRALLPTLALDRAQLVAYQWFLGPDAGGGAARVQDYLDRGGLFELELQLPAGERTATIRSGR